MCLLVVDVMGSGDIEGNSNWGCVKLPREIE